MFRIFICLLIKVNLFDKQILATVVKGLDLLCTLIRDKDIIALYELLLAPCSKTRKLWAIFPLTTLLLCF